MLGIFPSLTELLKMSPLSISDPKYCTPSTGSCSHGAHRGRSKNNAGKLNWANQNGPISGCQPQRPSQVVSAGWTFQDSVRLNQEAHHQHEVNCAANSADSGLSSILTPFNCLFLVRD